jgi:hypothetical protein
MPEFYLDISYKKRLYYEESVFFKRAVLYSLYNSVEFLTYLYPTNLVRRMRFENIPFSKKYLFCRFLQMSRPGNCSEKREFFKNVINRHNLLQKDG